MDTKRDTLIAKENVLDDPMSRLMALVAGKDLPTVSVAIEERHLGHAVLDPAAETELSLMLHDLGFHVVDAVSCHDRNNPILADRFHKRIDRLFLGVAFLQDRIVDAAHARHLDRFAVNEPIENIDRVHAHFINNVSALALLGPPPPLPGRDRADCPLP